MRRASSPAPALPVEPATAEQEATESVRCPAVVEHAPPKEAEDATRVGQTAGSTTPVECADEALGRRSGDVAQATTGVGDRDPRKGAVVDRTDSVPALGDGSERKVMRMIDLHQISSLEIVGHACAFVLSLEGRHLAYDRVAWVLYEETLRCWRY